MVPPARDMQHLAFFAYRLHTARMSTCFSVESEQILGNAEWGGDVRAVGGDVKAWHGVCRGVGYGREHQPVFRAADDGVPGGGAIGVGVEGRAGAGRTDDEPAMVRAVRAKGREKVG